jgi:hypothetical protein
MKDMNDLDLLSIDDVEETVSEPKQILMEDKVAEENGIPNG